MATVTIKQTEWFDVWVDDEDEDSDEDIIARALADGDAWESSGYLEVEPVTLVRDYVITSLGE